jgi:hypothetical protein
MEYISFWCMLDGYYIIGWRHKYSKAKKVLLDDDDKDGQEINALCMYMSKYYHHNAGQNHNIKIPGKW